MISWINPKITINAAGEKGIGSFANSPIAKDEVVVIQGGRILNYKDIEESDYNPFRNHCFQVEKDFLICPIEPREESLDGVYKINHSCNPNCGFRGQIVVVAMRDIAAGEEITYDYAMTDANYLNANCEEMKCLCGSKNCRGSVTGEDWRLQELQMKYKGYFSTHIQAMIDGENC
jgi:SET domain-containing protein